MKMQADRAHVCRVRVGGWENFEPFLLPKMLLIWCVHSACDPIFGQRPTINSLYVQLWLRTYMCSTTKSQLHLTWLEVWWSLGSYQSMFHHAMRGDTLSHSIETIYDLWWSFGLTHPCSTTLWAPDHSTSIIMRQCKDKGHISHPQEKPQSTSTGGRGGRGSRWVHYIGGGVGGGLAKPGSLGRYLCFHHFLPWNHGIWPIWAGKSRHSTGEVWRVLVKASWKMHERTRRWFVFVGWKGSLGMGDRNGFPKFSSSTPNIQDICCKEANDLSIQMLQTLWPYASVAVLDFV